MAGEPIIVMTSAPLRRAMDLAAMTDDFIPRIRIQALDNAAAVGGGSLANQ